MIMRHAFTMVEILIAMAVIAILASVLLVAVKPIKDAARKQTTNQILGIVNQAILLGKAQTGTIMSPAEHPVAYSGLVNGSRLQFIRNTLPTDAGLPIDTLTALTFHCDSGISDTTALIMMPAPRNLLLLPSDIFVDGATYPPYANLTRNELTIFGLPSALPIPTSTSTTYYGRLRRPIPGVSTQFDLTNGYDLVGPIGSNYDAATDLQQLTYFLGGTAQLDELSKLHAFFQPSNQQQASRTADGRFVDVTLAGINLPIEGIDGRLLSGRRVVIPGPAVYDSYGCEIFYRLGGDGNPVLRSSGKDGIFGTDDDIQTNGAK